MGIGDHGNKVGRPTDYTQYLGDAIIEMVREGLSIRRISAILKIHKSKITRWQHMFPEFKAHLKQARYDYETGKIERSLAREAVGYRYTETTREIAEKPGPDGKPRYVITKKVSKRARGNVAAMQMWLTNVAKDRWKVRRHTETDVRVGLIDPKKSYESRMKEFEDIPEAEIVEPKQIEEGKDD